MPWIVECIQVRTEPKWRDYEPGELAYRDHFAGHSGMPWVAIVTATRSGAVEEICDQYTEWREQEHMAHVEPDLRLNVGDRAAIREQGWGDVRSWRLQVREVTELPRMYVQRTGDGTYAAIIDGVTYGPFGGSRSPAESRARARLAVLRSPENMAAQPTG